MFLPDFSPIKTLRRITLAGTGTSGNAFELTSPVA
jgi:hypothetical protein